MIFCFFNKNTWLQFIGFVQPPRNMDEATKMNSTRLFSYFRGNVDSDSSFWSQNDAAKGKKHKQG